MSDLGLVTRLTNPIHPDIRRVLVKLFVPGEDDAVVRSRAVALIDRIRHLDEAGARSELDETLQLFAGRHRDLEETFRHHYELMHHRVLPTRDLSPTGQMLVGAYFSHEYAVEAAALCNPSMVAHPDQSGVDVGRLRVIVSLRQIGEGHLSSIGFATGLIGPGPTDLEITERSGALVSGKRNGARHQRDLLAAGLSEEGSDTEVSATVLGSLPEYFGDADLDQALAGLPPDLLIRGTTQSTIELMRRLVATSYSVNFPEDVPLEDRTLWPTAASECLGMEDARFVRSIAEDGRVSYRATYTAYDGKHIGGRLISTVDFTHFEVAPLRGPGARNKGMALFPRPVNGHHLALCRADGETLGLTTLGPDARWCRPAMLHAPSSAWELIQVGNCGSPIETPEGWLVLTHGVGAMRRYAIGALLLDLENPDHVIAELPGALMAPSDTEREGYVPNVVYSCGALLHEGTIWLPYGVSDCRVEFASIDLAALLNAMVHR